MARKKRSGLGRDLNREAEVAGKKLSDAVSRMARAIGLLGTSKRVASAGRKGGQVQRTAKRVATEPRVLVRSHATRAKR